MNFDLTKSKLIPFSVSEKEVRDRFLDFIIDNDNAPVDVAYTAKIISVNKVYFPIRCFDIEYSADWSATSIWEHKEEYTEYEPKTVYIDYYGKEHKSPGFDKFHNGTHIGTTTIASSGTRPFKAQQKMVPITKHKTVIDNIEQTYGSIGIERAYEPIITYNDDSEKGLCDWILGSAIGGKPVQSQPTLMHGCEIKPLIYSDEHACDIAMSNVSTLATSQCRREVPGDRYTDLSVYNLDTTYNMEIILISVYHIEYEHEGQKYECFTSGSKSSTYFYNTMPEEDNIKNENEAQKEKVRNQKSRKWKWFFLVYLLMPFAVFFFFMYSIAIYSAIPVLATIILEIILLVKYSRIKKELKESLAVNENYLTILRNKRFGVAVIMRNSDLSEEDRRTAVYNIIGK